MHCKMIDGAWTNLTKTFGTFLLVKEIDKVENLNGHHLLLNNRKVLFEIEV